jgi:hypothetical protein
VAERRQEVQLRILSDIPMAYWQAVYPDKLLQFKPLDGLRVDLITVIGAIAVLAQIRYESRLLEFLTLIPVIITAVRSVLGYQRMSTRYENLVNDMIASKTIAQDEAVVDSLAASAAQQQFAAAAVAYAVLLRDAGDGGLMLAEVRERGEAALVGAGHGGVRFDARAGLLTLSELGMIEAAEKGQRSLVDSARDASGARTSILGKGKGKTPAQRSVEDGLASASELPPHDPMIARWVPADMMVAQQKLSRRWMALLEESVVITAEASARTAFVQQRKSADDDKTML